MYSYHSKSIRLQCTVIIVSQSDYSVIYHSPVFRSCTAYIYPSRVIHITPRYRHHRGVDKADEYLCEKTNLKIGLLRYISYRIKRSCLLQKPRQKNLHRLSLCKTFLTQLHKHILIILSVKFFLEKVYLYFQWRGGPKSP